MQLSVPFYPLIVVPLAVAAWFFWARARRHIGMLRLGRPLVRSDRPLERIRGLGVFVFGQKRLLRDPGPGLMHFVIFWGFIVLLATTGNYLTNGLVETIVAWPLAGALWQIAIFVANLFIGLIIVALGYAAFRRLVTRPTRLALSRDAFVILALIFGVVVTELFGDAFRYVAHPGEPTRGVALLAGPLSAALAGVGSDTALIGFGAFAWAHIVFVLGFGSYLPHSKHLHILTSEPNVYFRNLEPRGALRRMDLEAEPVDGAELTFGAKTLEDLTWRHLLDPMTCTECGRCMEFCPASMTGKTLSPKHFMEGLRDQITMAETAIAAAAGCAARGEGRRRRRRGGGGRRVGAGPTACRRRAEPADREQRHP